MDMTTDIGAGGSHLPYRWRPMEFEYQGWEYVNERAIATQQTGWWYVAQAMPDKKYGRFWFGVDDAGTSPLMIRDGSPDSSSRRAELIIPEELCR